MIKINKNKECAWWAQEVGAWTHTTPDGTLVKDKITELFNITDKLSENIFNVNQKIKKAKEELKNLNKEKALNNKAIKLATKENTVYNRAVKPFVYAEKCIEKYEAFKELSYEI